MNEKSDYKNNRKFLGNTGPKFHDNRIGCDIFDVISRAYAATKFRQMLLYKNVKHLCNKNIAYRIKSTSRMGEKWETVHVTRSQ